MGTQALFQYTHKHVHTCTHTDTGRQTGFVTESRQLRRHAVKIQTCRQNGWLRERERERERDSDRDRQRQTETDIERKKITVAQTMTKRQTK